MKKTTMKKEISRRTRTRLRLLLEDKSMLSELMKAVVVISV